MTSNIYCGRITLHAPPGLPHLAHVNSVATYPGYQRQGMTSVCLHYALKATCKKGQKFYLETYDDLYLLKSDIMITS